MQRHSSFYGKICVTVLSKLLPLSLPPLFCSPSYPPHLSVSSVYLYQFHFAKWRTWNLIFDLKNTYTGTVFDVLSEDFEGNAFWLILLVV